MSPCFCSPIRRSKSSIVLKRSLPTPTITSPGRSGVRAMQSPRGWILAVDNDTLFDGLTVKDSAAPSLDNVADFLRKHPGRRVAIEGFSDGERLSERRAQAVKFALVQRGIEPHRIDARGYGPSTPGRMELVIS